MAREREGSFRAVMENVFNLASKAMRFCDLKYLILKNLGGLGRGFTFNILN